MKKVVKNSKLDMFIKLFFIFFIGCIVGWIYEEIFYYVTENIIENRGFLYGPYLPVYGVGAVFIYLLLNKYKKKPYIIFFGSIIVTGIVEYITGYLLFLIYQRRWWDYTGLFMELDGYVCLRSVISFAIAALALIYMVVPFVEKFINKKKISLVLTIVISLVMIIDLIFTLIYRY